MSDISSLTEDSLIKFKEYLEMNKKNLSTKKLKTLAILNYALGLMLVGAGVATLILFPSPVTVAVLGGVAVLAGRKNPKKTLQKIKENKKKKVVIKADLVTIENRLNEMKTEEAIKKSMYPSLNPYFVEK